jgi:hypothetical protein
MTQIKPFIKCVDFWPGQIPPEKLQIYKAMIKEGQIIKHQVLYNQLTGSTTVEYFSIAPHEWILQQMRQRQVKQLELSL